MESIKERLMTYGIDHISDASGVHFGYIDAKYDKDNETWIKITFYDGYARRIGEVKLANLSKEQFDEVKREIHHIQHYSSRDYETLFQNHGHRYIAAYVHTIELNFSFNYILSLKGSAEELDDFFAKANQ